VADKRGGASTIKRIEGKLNINKISKFAWVGEKGEKLDSDKENSEINKRPKTEGGKSNRKSGGGKSLIQAAGNFSDRGAEMAQGGTL